MSRETALPKEFDQWTRMALHLGWHGVYQIHAEQFIAAAKKVERNYYRCNLGEKYQKAMDDGRRVVDKIAKAYGIELEAGYLVRIKSNGCFRPNVEVDV